jgi:hypothetical protein
MFSNHTIGLIVLITLLVIVGFVVYYMDHKNIHKTTKTNIQLSEDVISNENMNEHENYENRENFNVNQHINSNTNCSKNMPHHHNTTTSSSNHKTVVPSNSYSLKSMNNTDDLVNTVHHHPHGPLKDNESIIYDSTTGSIMTGSQFMDTTGLITPPYVPPAWNPNQEPPKTKSGEIDVNEYMNDPRLIYNKCGIQYCSSQMSPTLDGTSGTTGVGLECGTTDDGQKLYSSNYTCTNNTGGSGCLALTKKQITDFHS